MLREDRLSPRERQVLALVRKGSTMQQIGDALGIRPKTVEAHKNHVAAKLGVRVRDLSMIVLTAAVLFGQRMTPDRPPFEFNVEKCSGDVCMTAAQHPGDAPDQFRVEVQAMKLADRALVTVLWESNPGGLPELHVSQALTNKTPTIVDKVASAAEFRGVPRALVTHVRVSLVKVIEVERQEFK